MGKVLLVRYGEIHLKGQNRPYFEKMLVRRIEQVLLEPEAKVVKAEGRFFVPNVQDAEAVGRRVARVFGVHSVSVADELDKDLELIAACAVRQLEELGGRGTFKVRARRSDKRFPLDSMEIGRELGHRILEALPALKVDVHHPDWEVGVEIREQAYVYTRIIPGVGGMPVGCNGKAISLLSGGIDSPVSSYMIAKRGVAVEFVHFDSFPFTSERSLNKVRELARILAEYAGTVKLHVVHFTEIQQAIYDTCPDAHLTLVMRRLMMRIANAIAREREALALVTGESVGQVASQTIEALVTTDDVADMPVFRPLIGMDKVEIMDYAARIGTYETSILPYEDCCTVFVPRHPTTRPKLEDIRRSEALLPYGEMVSRAVAERTVEEITFEYR